MKFSFQTLCILFLVTLIHLVLISAFSAMRGSSSTILSDLKADALLQELVLQASSSGEVPETKKEEELEKKGNPEKSLPGNPLKTNRQEIADESLETPAEDTLTELSSNETEHHDMPAIADARLLSGRIASPKLEDYRPRAEIAVAEERKSEPKKEAQPAAGRAESIAKSVAKPVPAPPAEGPRSIRSIRPIPRS